MNLTFIGSMALMGLLFVLILGILVLLIARRRRASENSELNEPDRQAKPPPHKPKEKTATAKRKSPPPPKATDTTTQILGGPADQHRGLPEQPEQGFAPEGEKIRILIVDDNTGTRENVSRLLYFEDDLEVIGQAVNGRHGVEMAIQLKPHIVLMDINMPDMDGITATQHMSSKAPYSQVIIMSVQADQHYMKRAMAAGARDFQPKPFTSEELVGCIRRVYNIGTPVYRQLETLEHAKSQPESMEPSKTDQQTSNTGHAPVIAVYSPKGGTGTSALATNLAIAFQQTQGETVLLDAAFQTGDVSVHLNTRPERSIADTIHDGVLEVDLVPEVLMAHHSGVKLLLAPPQPEVAEIVTANIVSKIITALKEQFNIVLVDTTSQLIETTLTVLDVADYVLVVTTPELPAIKSAKLFLELSEQLEFDPTRVFVVINRSDMPGGVQPAQIEKVLKLKHTFRVPNDSKMHFTLNRGASVCLTEPSASSSKAIMTLAKDFYERISKYNVV